MKNPTHTWLAAIMSGRVELAMTERTVHRKIKRRVKRHLGFSVVHYSKPNMLAPRVRILRSAGATRKRIVKLFDWLDFG